MIADVEFQANRDDPDKLLDEAFVGVWIAAPAKAVEKEAKTVRLFNGRDLTGWTPFIWDPRAAKPDTTTPVDKVWDVKEGVLICHGRPTGYLKAEGKFENYRLVLEWRWPEDTQTGNSGVLVHVTTPKALGQWPKSVEVQLYTRNAGDFWVIGTTLQVPNQERRKRDRDSLVAP